MINGSILRDAIISAANNLQNQKASVDELNVFPVPDGDTGTNMCMTIGAARRELEKLPDDCTVAAAAQTAASAMLRGARGNSGVITSLLFRGFAKALAGKEQADCADIVAAFAGGVAAAYKAVMKPTEGTILTVARVASEQAAACGAQEMTALWDVILSAAKEALAKTPEQLPVLKKAGVVDAGGQGFCVILDGMYSVICGSGIMACEEAAAPRKKSTANVGKGVYTAELNPDITNGYCTEFIVNKAGGCPSAEKLRAFLESNGDSVVVVDDDEIIKAHVHTEDPGRILSHALGYGYLTNLKIENMHEQYAARQAEARGLEKQAEAEAEAARTGDEFPYAAVDDARPYGFVSVAAGDGLRALFGDLGVDAVVSGGQTMNPSTDSIVCAVQSVPAKTVFVLPNNKNIIMAAEQAAKIADRKVVVLPTRTVPQGMTAMLNFDADNSVEENQMAMMDAADKVATGLITFAARNSDFDGHKIKKGEILALENGKLVFTDRELEHAVLKLTRSMVGKNTGFVTVISGADVSNEAAEAVCEALRAKLGTAIEVTHVEGGQPVYYYMISVE